MRYNTKILITAILSIAVTGCKTDSDDNGQGERSGDVVIAIGVTPSLRWTPYSDSAPALPVPQKHPIPVLTPTEPWELVGGLVDAYGSSVDMGDRMRLYYRMKTPKPAGVEPMQHTAYAETFDYVNFSKPMVPGKTSNVVVEGQRSWNVIWDSERQQFLGVGRHKRGVSEDGVNWRNKDWPISYPKNDTHTGFTKCGGRYYATVRDWLDRNGTNVRRVAMTSSVNFDGMDSKRIIIDPADPMHQPYGMQLTCYNSPVYGEILIGQVWWYHVDQTRNPINMSCGTIDAEFVWSSDGGVTWHRTRRAYLAPTPGSFDQFSTAPQGFFFKNGMAYIYYTATKSDHCATKQPGDTVIGLATMPVADIDYMIASSATDVAP